MPTKILVIDDHPLIRRGLKWLLEQQDDIDVVGEAATLDEARALLKDMRPDVVILDLVLGDQFALELIKETRAFSPSTLTIVISARDELLFAKRCLKNGAVGYLEKSGDLDAVIEAVRAVINGETVVSEAVQKLIVRTTGETELTPQDVLSDRELQVFQLIGTGMTTREIAVLIDRSVKTVESYRERIKSKMQLENAAKLSHVAFEWTNNSVGK